MGRFHQLLALILLLAVTASGQVVTSDAGALTSRVWGVTVNVPWYLRAIVVQGATPIDLTDRYVSFTVRQVDTEALVHSSTGTIHVVNPGEVIFTWTPRAPGTFAAAAVIRRTDTGETVANIMDDTITVTNPPSAGANVTVNPTVGAVSLSLVPLIPSNGSIGTIAAPWGELNAQTARVEKLIAADLDVSGAITAIDTGRVSKLGDVMTGPLTNEYGYYGNGAGLTNLPAASVAALNDIGDVDAAPATGDLLSWDGAKWTNLPPADSGGYIGSVQLVTNSQGQVGYTNAAGHFSALPGWALPGDGVRTYISDYSTDTIVSNRNIGTVTYFFTNETLVGLLPNETAGLRMVDYRPITSGTWVRAGVEWVQRPQRGKVASAGAIRSGIAWLGYAGNTNYLFGAQNVGNNEPVWKHKYYAANFGFGGDIYGNAPYDVLLASINLSEFPQSNWDLWDHNGTNVGRGFSMGEGGFSPTLLQLSTNPAFNGPIQGFAIGLNSDSAATGRATNVAFQVRRMIIQEGALWIDPSYQ